MEFLCVESNGQAETGSRLFLPREVTPFKPLKMLIYETEPLETSSAARHVRRANDMRGINVTVIGQGTDHKGFGSKYTAAVSGTYCNVDMLFPPLSLPPLDTDTLSPCSSLLFSYMILSSQHWKHCLKTASLYSVIAEM